MKKVVAAKTARGASRDVISVDEYVRAQKAPLRSVCTLLKSAIDEALPKAASRVWHGGPVWFVGENPVVGFDAKADRVELLFWNGQAFGDEALEPVGKYGAARATFRVASEVDPKVLRRRLALAGTDVLDSKALFARLRKQRAPR